jgi:hypothetical protein
MKILSLAPLLALSLAACGGASEPAATAPVAPVADEHGAMPAPVVAFHDSLKPLWHDQTPERQAKTCAALDELDARATALPTAEVAPARKDAYVTAASGLTASLGELRAACGGSGDFTASFSKVHDGFHALMEASGGHHGEHEQQGAPKAEPHGDHAGHAH